VHSKRLPGDLMTFRPTLEVDWTDFDDRLSLADRMRMWEQDERVWMNQEYERSFGSSHVVVGVGDVRD
jgi:hypothetical protein